MGDGHHLTQRSLRSTPAVTCPIDAGCQSITRLQGITQTVRLHTHTKSAGALADCCQLDEAPRAEAGSISIMGPDNTPTTNNCAAPALRLRLTPQHTALGGLQATQQLCKLWLRCGPNIPTAS